MPEPAGRSRRRLTVAAGLTAGILAVELAAALVAHSVALLADAGHVAVDLVALVLAAVAAVQAGRPPTARQTYGFHRVGVLVAVANALVLLLVVGGVAALAASRLGHPGRPSAGIMLAAAGLGVLVNGSIAWWLHGARSLNVRAAVLHAGADATAGLAVVGAAIVVLATGWRPADPVASLLIAAVIALMAVRLIREGVHVLLEAVPPGLALPEVEALIEATPGVLAVHDLHVWALAEEQRALSCHVALAEQSLPEAEHLIQRLSERLCGAFHLGHTTIQVEACHPCPPGPCAGEGPTRHNHPHVAAAGSVAQPAAQRRPG